MLLNKVFIPFWDMLVGIVAFLVSGYYLYKALTYDLGDFWVGLIVWGVALFWFVLAFLVVFVFL